MLKLSSGTFRHLFESGAGLAMHPSTRRFTRIASGMITSHESRENPSVLLKSKHSTKGWRTQLWSSSVSDSPHVEVRGSAVLLR